PRSAPPTAGSPIPDRLTLFKFVPISSFIVRVSIFGFRSLDFQSSLKTYHAPTANANRYPVNRIVPRPSPDLACAPQSASGSKRGLAPVVYAGPCPLLGVCESLSLFAGVRKPIVSSQASIRMFRRNRRHRHGKPRPHGRNRHSEGDRSTLAAVDTKTHHSA